jgi:RNA polymerase sigma factor (sigma-70 family)
VRSDAELLEAWRAGDLGAGKTLFERHIAVVSRFFRNKIGDEREDLIQRTFLACVESRDRLRDGGAFLPYVLRVARSKLYDHFAQRRGGLHRPDALETSVADLGASPSVLIAKGQQADLLLHALRRLPMELQIAIELHYWEGMSTADLAELLEIPQGTVKTRLFRARQLLREHLHALTRAGRLPESSLHDLDGWARSLRGLLEAEAPSIG